jgi:hypothetical protein
MLKWIIWFIVIWIWVWWVSAYFSSYTPISKQVDLKTMSLKKPDFIIKKWNICTWTCRNYSTSTSYWSSSYWWK